MKEDVKNNALQLKQVETGKHGTSRRHWQEMPEFPFFIFCMATEYISSDAFIDQSRFRDTGESSLAFCRIRASSQAQERNIAVMRYFRRQVNDRLRTIDYRAIRRRNNATKPLELQVNV